MQSNRDIDAQLVEKVQAGDTRAFDMLVLKYQRRVLRLVHRLIKHEGEAEEVAQEVFIKAYRSIHQFRLDSAFYTWLYRIAINTAHTWLSQGKNKMFVSDEISSREGETFSQIESLIDDRTPENSLAQQEMAREIQVAVDELPEDLRMAFLLREVEGFSYEEIAEAMGSPPGTVRSRIYRARETIAKKLQPHLGQKYQR